MHPVNKKNVFTTLHLALLVIFALLVSVPAFAATENGNYPRVIEDSHGKKIEVVQPFQRIISLYSAHTENLCRMGATDQLVGISASDDYPDEILGKRKFSYREDAERFISEQPDLVLVRPMIERSYPQFIQKLEAAGITVISLQPTSIEEMFAYWHTLGVISGHEEASLAMVESFKNSIAAYDSKLLAIDIKSRPTVYFEAIHDKMKTFAEDSIAMFVLEHGGGRNIARDASRVRTTNIAFFGKEQLLSHGEEIDVFLSQHGRMNPVTVDTIKNEPGFMAIRAVREGKIFLVEEPLVSRPTMRILEGIEKLHSFFFPAQETREETQS